jgi:putative endonuclease
VKDDYVYIATNRSRMLYYERFNDVRMAIGREKQIKGWRRSKKIALIESVNPGWMEGESPWLP